MFYILLFENRGLHLQTKKVIGWRQMSLMIIFSYLKGMYELLPPKFRLAAVMRRSTVFNVKVEAINNLASITAIRACC